MSQENVELLRKLYAESAQGSFGETDYYDPEVEFQWSRPSGGQWTALPDLYSAAS
jgi:hypothetical protein